MWGMISAGCGLGPGTWMPRRLQRAFRYGTSRVALRAASSVGVLGNGMSQIVFAFMRSFSGGQPGLVVPKFGLSKEVRDEVRSHHSVALSLR